MSKRIFSEVEIKILEKNDNVLKVSSKSITYSKDFKLFAVKEYLSGKAPSQIFLEAGFNLDMVGEQQPKRCLSRWRNTYNKYGDEGLLRDNRGKCATGRTKIQELTETKKLEKAQARIKYLEAELDFIKKLEALERQAKKKK